MKLKLFWVAVALVFCCSANVADTATVLEETGFLYGLSGETYSFVADQTPLVYSVTLTDLEFPAAFDFLGVAVTTSTDNVIELLAPGTTSFSPELGTTYFANILGAAADPPGVGLFGIKIAAVPLPSALYLLGTGILVLVALKRRN